jgi:hypothetical protein
MAAESEVKILTVDAVQNMADLRKAIRDTKAALDGMELGSDEYRETLQELIKENIIIFRGHTKRVASLRSGIGGNVINSVEYIILDYLYFVTFHAQKYNRVSTDALRKRHTGLRKT